MAGSFGSGRTTGGISGSGGSKVTPIYKMQGGSMGPAKIQGPQLPKKKSPSIVSKIKNAFADKPKYPSDVIVGNKKMDAAEAARKNK